MDNVTETKETLRIAKDHVGPLIGRFSMVQNELAGLFDLPPPSAPSAEAAGTWWQGLAEEQQHTYRAALAAVASPLLIADVGINSRNERLTNTHAVLPSLRWNDPIFLIASEKDGTQFQLEYLRQADLFTNSLLLYLHGGAPVYQMEMKFELPVRDFAVLLATVDLRQRLRFQALLDHTTYPTSFKADDIAAATVEGLVLPDPRWLLPFSLPVLHIRAGSLSSASARQSLENLVKTGLLNRDGDFLTLTEPGERFTESVAGRTSCIGIDTYGVDVNGNPGRQSVLLIRGDQFLWYAGIGGPKKDTVVVTCIGIDQAGALLQELFTPVAVPKPGLTPVPAPSPEVVQVSAPAAPDSAPVPAERKFCPSCGKPHKPGLKFCISCGTKIN